MEPKKITSLIAEDHLNTSDSYCKILENIGKENIYEFECLTANDCDSATKLISELSGKKRIDLALIDIKIPPSQCCDMNSGEDVGIFLKKLHPDAKILALTSFTENYRLNNIFKLLNPDGLLIKAELTFEILSNAIKSVLEDTPYYDKRVLRLMRKKISNDIIIDEIDRKILYQISLGTKTKDLPKYINLSLPGIERRKRNLKNLFNIEGVNNKLLTQRAEEYGFI